MMVDADTISALNRSAWKAREKDKSKAKELAQQALTLAQKTKNKDQELLARLTLSQVANYRMELDEALKHIDHVNERIQENTEREVVARYYHQRCFYYYQKSQFTDLIETGHKMLEFINNNGFEDYRAWVLSTMGMAYQRLGNGNLALESYQRSEVLAKKINNMGLLSNVQMSTGTALAELGRASEAMEFFEQALTIRLAEGGDFHAGITLANMAKVLSQFGEHSKALLRWDEGIVYLRRAGGMPLWAQGIAGRADTLRQMGRFADAQAELTQLIKEATDLPAPIQINLYLSLSRVYADAQKWNESIGALTSAQKLMDDTTTGLTQRVELHTAFHLAYKSMNNVELALHHHEQKAHHHEKLLNEQSVTKLAEWEALYQMERLREKDEKLSQKTSELEEVYKTTATEKEILLEKLANYEVLLDEMLSKLPSTHQGRFSRLVRAARKENTESNSDQLVQNRIAEKHPELTPTELRVCSMIVHGWSTKEIANRSGTSTKNIEKHRGAIRRKAAIPRSVSLQVYLSGLTKLI